MIHVPQPPPEPVVGVEGPTYVSHDGEVWRRGCGSWSNLDALTATRLLALYRKDATQQDDWFRVTAQRLADELEAAMREAGHIEHRSAA